MNQIELGLEGTVIPYCSCGDCTIKITEHSDHYEYVSSGGESAIAFSTPTVEAERDDCEVTNVVGGTVRPAWRRREKDGVLE